VAIQPLRLLSYREQEVVEENRDNRQALDHCAQGMRSVLRTIGAGGLECSSKGPRKEALCVGKR
jgi:hypothetical protein